MFFYFHNTTPRHIIAIINYWNKNIEFVSYDYPYTYEKENENLKNYKIRDMRITHSSNLIKLSFKKKDLIAAIGIIVTKYNLILPSIREEVSLFLEIENVQIPLPDNEEIIFKKCIILNLDHFSFIITSTTYDLEEHKAIITYYNLNDEYEDEILEEILRDIVL